MVEGTWVVIINYILLPEIIIYAFKNMRFIAVAYAVLSSQSNIWELEAVH